MRKLSLLISLSIFLGSPAYGQSLVPATSEDLGEFDRQIQEAQMKRPPEVPSKAAAATEKSESSAQAKEKKPKSNFGTLVSQEAKKMKESDPNQRRGMGQWVREQRRQNEVQNPSASQAPGSAGSVKNPALENSSNAPGQSGKKKK